MSPNADTASQSAPENRQLRKLEFGNFPTVLGDLQKNGVTAVNINCSSNQDAFGVSRSGNSLAIGDGLGSYAYSGGASRLVTRVCAEDDCQRLMTEDWKQWLEQDVGEAIRSDPGFVRKFEKKTSSDRALTTLTAARRVDGTEGVFRYFVLGDSPLYVVDDKNEIRTSVGTETAGDSGVDGHVEIFPDGRVIVTGEPKQGTVKLEPGWKLVLASDYVSDGLVRPLDEARAVRDSLRQEKKEGGYAYINGKTVPPSRIPMKAGESQEEYMARLKDKYDWHPWIDSVHDKNLEHAEKVVAFQKSFAEDPEKVFEKYKNDAAILSELRGYHAKNQRSLAQLLDMTTAELETHVKDREGRWKDDDLTLGIFGYARGEEISDAADTIPGADTMAGGAGTDSIAGGEGDDTIPAAAGGGAAGGEPPKTPSDPPAPGSDPEPTPRAAAAAEDPAVLAAKWAELQAEIAKSRALEAQLAAIRAGTDRILSAPAPAPAPAPVDHAIEPAPRPTPDHTPTTEPAPHTPDAHPAPHSPDAHPTADRHGAGHDAHPPGGHGHGHGHGDGHGHGEPWHLPRNASEAGYLIAAIGIGTWNVAKFFWQFVLHPIIHTTGYVISGDAKHPWKSFWDGFTGDLKKAFFGKGGGGKSHGGGHGGGGHGGGGHGGGH
jgi:hypothetical protein